MRLDPNKIRPFYEFPKIPEFYKVRTFTAYETSSITPSWRWNYKWLQECVTEDKLPEGVYIAGDAALSEIDNKSIEDVDMFCTSSKAFCDAYEMLSQSHIPDIDQHTLEANSKYVKVVNFTKGPMTVGPVPNKIQLIKQYWFTGADHVIDSFDFTICQIAFGRNLITWNSVTSKDIDNKVLRIHRIQWPVNTLRRMAKYINKGYQIAVPQDLTALADKIAKSKSSADEEIYTDPATPAVITVNPQQPKLNLSKPPKFDLGW